jgi:hypothetical protein
VLFFFSIYLFLSSSSSQSLMSWVNLASSRFTFVWATFSSTFCVMRSISTSKCSSIGYTTAFLCDSANRRSSSLVAYFFVMSSEMEVFFSCCWNCSGYARITSSLSLLRFILESNSLCESTTTCSTSKSGR